MARQIAVQAKLGASCEAGTSPASPKNGSFLEQRWTMLSWAKLALGLGARLSIVERVTGVERRELRKLFFAPGDRQKSPGNMPSSAEWFIQANNAEAVHIADFYARFDKLRAAMTPPAEALIKAYALYRRLNEHDKANVLSFDRAFDLITHVDGLWTKVQPELQATICPRCQSLFIAAVGSAYSSASCCPICKLRRRCDADLQRNKPLRPPLRPLYGGYPIAKV